MGVTFYEDPPVSASFSSPVNDGNWHALIIIWNGAIVDILVDGIGRTDVHVTTTLTKLPV